MVWLWFWCWFLLRRKPKQLTNNIWLTLYSPKLNFKWEDLPASAQEAASLESLTTEELEHRLHTHLRLELLPNFEALDAKLKTSDDLQKKSSKEFLIQGLQTIGIEAKEKASSACEFLNSELTKQGFKDDFAKQNLRPPTPLAPIAPIPVFQPMPVAAPQRAIANWVARNLYRNQQRS